jgi:hypothetical protein
MMAPLLAFAFVTTFVVLPAQHASATGITSGSPDFTMSVVPLSQTRKRGTGAPYDVTVNSVNGFNGHVSLTLTGNIPSTGTVGIGDPTGFGPLGAGGVTIQIAKVNDVIGTFDMTINATSGSIVHHVNISLTIR